MSRHKRSSSRKRHKSKKCPEPLNSMIDLAGGLAMAAIAGSMEKKHHYKARGKINPYEVSALGIATGRMKTTDDIIRTGAVLGALGSFDDDSVAGDDDLFSMESYIHTNDNRYAWRLNCEDGTEYGISPEDYETRDEYNEALRTEKYAWRDFCEDGSEYGLDPEDFETEDEYDAALEAARESADDTPEEDAAEFPGDEILDTEMKANQKVIHEAPVPCGYTVDPFADDDFHVYVYCKVKLHDMDTEVYYRTEDHSLRKGDAVLVPSPIAGNEVVGEILTVEHHMKFSVPTPIEETQVILRKI